MDLHYLYRPLRNHLQQVDLRESLQVVRSYLDYLHQGLPLPNDIELPAELQLSGTLKFRVQGFLLDSFCKEILINAGILPAKNKSLQQWRYFESAIIKLKVLEEKLYVECVPSDRIWTELLRIAHRQFPWQENASSSSALMRYYKMYSWDALSGLFQEFYGMSVSTYFMIASVLFGHFSKSFSLRNPPVNRISKIQQDDLDAFLRMMSIDWKSLRKLLSEENAIDERYPYRFYSHRTFPLILCSEYSKPEYLCPIPTHLFWRITEGIFYDLVNLNRFSDFYGPAFQAYIGEVLLEAMDKNKMGVAQESSYTVGRNRKDTVDWILFDQDAAIFIETKTKKLVQSAKEEVETDHALHDQLEYQCGHVLQLYKTITDYENGHYPNFPYNRDIEIYPIVVTLDNWHLFGHEQLDFIDGKVIEMLEVEGIDAGIRERYPYSFCSAREFERCVEIIGRVGISRAIGGKVSSPEHVKWELSPYLAEKFPSEWQKTGNLFRAQFQRLFESWVNGE